MRANADRSLNGWGLLRSWIRRHQLVLFFCLAYFISYASLFTFIYLYLGQSLPRWSLVWFLNVTGLSPSALIMAFLAGGWSQVRQLLTEFTRWNVGLRWYFGAAFVSLAPLAITLIYTALGQPSAGLQPGETVWTLSVTVVFALFSGPLSEELGWRGFALPRLQVRYNALVSSLILGVIWCFWHLPLFFTPGAAQLSIPFPI
jgi:uncharacterized protein